MEAIERGNAVVFLDVALGEGAGAPVLGRIKLELFVKDVRIWMGYIVGKVKRRSISHTVCLFIVTVPQDL